MATGEFVGVYRPGIHTLPDSFFEIPVYEQHFRNTPVEDRKAIQQQFAPDQAYFRQGKVWLGVKPKEARLVGFVQPGMQFSGQKTAFFGFLESMPDGQALAQLWQELKTWAKAEGATALTGPINFSTFGSYRIRLAGQESDEIFIGEPMNPPYYETLLKGLGLKEIAHYTTEIFAIHERSAQHYDDLVQGGKHPFYQKFRVESITREVWRQRQEDFYRATVEIFAGNAGFQLISQDEFWWLLGEQIGRTLCPKASCYLIDRETEAFAGYFIIFPNYGVLQHRDAKPRTLGTWELDYDQHAKLLEHPTVVGKTLGVMPDYRGKGVQVFLSAEGFLRMYRAGYVSCYQAMMKTDNASTKLRSPFVTDVRDYGLFGVGI